MPASAATLVAALPTDVVDDVLVVGEAGSSDAARLLQAYGLRPRLRTRSPDPDGGPVPSYAELLALEADVLVLVAPDDRGDPRLVAAMASMIASGACDVVVERRAAAGQTVRSRPAPAPVPVPSSKRWMATRPRCWTHRRSNGLSSLASRSARSSSPRARRPGRPRSRQA